MVFLFFFFFDKKYRYNSADSSPALFFNAWILKYVSFVINQKKKVHGQSCLMANILICYTGDIINFEE